MTDNEHPITPPPELVEQWMREAHDQPPGPDARFIATKAARWGADQELQWCANAIYATLSEVEKLCEEHEFGVDGYESTECLQGLINDAIARWGHLTPQPPVDGGGGGGGG